jgi:hypothetical protein
MPSPVSFVRSPPEAPPFASFWPADLATPRAHNEVMGTGRGQDPRRGRDSGSPMPAVDLNRMVNLPDADLITLMFTRAGHAPSPSQGRWDRLGDRPACSIVVDGELRGRSAAFRTDRRPPRSHVGEVRGLTQSEIASTEHLGDHERREQCQRDEAIALMGVGGDRVRRLRRVGLSV